jgi:Protein of unknown function (DUF2510)
VGSDVIERETGEEMSTNGPPQGGFSGAPPAPVAVQQTTVIQMGTHKNVVGAVVLAFLFGPLGMLYATVTGGVVMFFVNIVVAFLTLGLGLFFTIPLGMLWAGIAASSHNKQLQAVATQQATSGQVAAPAGPPAAWHDDPNGSGRLRFHDGTRWTDNYADKPGQPSDEPAQPAAASKQLPGAAKEPAVAAEVIDEEDVTVVLKSGDPAKASCTSCGHGIDPQARFCSACGQAQTIA